MNPRLQFLGGVGTVTGSKFLLRTDEGNVLIDCGLFQGLKELRLQNWQELPVDIRSVHAVVLTHAHLDHSGYIPLLVRNGFSGKVYCTEPTRDLAEIILSDSARIQEEDADFANKKGYSKHHPAKPLYTTEDVRFAMRSFFPVSIDRWIPLFEGLKFRFSKSGHILGSVFIELSYRGKRIVFSGDLGRSKPLMLTPPTRLERADYLVVESTYGDRSHPKESPMHALGRIINETIARNGHVIIPSFAVGRVQDVLLLISKLKRQKTIPDVPIYLDSPMGIDATRVLFENSDWHRLNKKEIKDLCDGVVMVHKQKDSKELLKMRNSTIVIAGSGMLSGGRVLHHLEKRLPDERNTVVLVGYQAAGTRGRLLRGGISELKMHGRYIPVKARIEEVPSLSAHADQAEIIAWLRNFKRAPLKTFIVHGEPAAADALRVRIADALQWPVEIPKPFESKTLSFKPEVTRNENNAQNSKSDDDDAAYHWKRYPLEKSGGYHERVSHTALAGTKRRRTRRNYF